MERLLERVTKELEIVTKQIEVGESKGAGFQTLSKLKADKQRLEFIKQSEEKRIERHNTEFKELAEMLMGRRKLIDNKPKNDGKIRLPG